MDAEQEKKPQTVTEEDIILIFQPTSSQKRIAGLFRKFFANSKSLGLTNQEAAALLDVSLPTLSRFKAGKLPKTLNKDKRMRINYFIFIMTILIKKNIDTRDFFFQKGFVAGFGDGDVFSFIRNWGLPAMERVLSRLSRSPKPR